LEALTKLVADDSPDVGYWAATLLGRLGERAAPAVSALASAVSGDLAMPVRQRSAWALGKIGPPAAPSLEALQQAADDPDARLARLAQRAIDQIGG
ncbi:MAG: HEAT repeat domain-containing protein, partial [Planctomycetes bacterium]|nr:HEAT repeat domain-containing protein [Planctomycetota bacterium]